MCFLNLPCSRSKSYFLLAFLYRPCITTTLARCLACPRSGCVCGKSPSERDFRGCEHNPVWLNRLLRLRLPSASRLSSHFYHHLLHGFQPLRRQGLPSAGSRSPLHPSSQCEDRSPASFVCRRVATRPPGSTAGGLLRNRQRRAEQGARRQAGGVRRSFRSHRERRSWPFRAAECSTSSRPSLLSKIQD